MNNQIWIRSKRELLLVKHMVQLFDVFNKNGIEYIPIKGPIWSMKLHGHLGKRPFTDIDFVFNINQFKSVREQLEGIGFKMIGVQNENLEQFINDNHEFQFIKYHNSIKLLIEPHFKLYNRNIQVHVTIESLKCYCSIEEIFGLKMQILNPTGMLAMSILNHIVSNNFQQPKPCSDIALIIKKFNNVIDWNSIIQFSKKYGFNRHLVMSLSLAAYNQDVKIPINLSLNGTLRILFFYTLKKYNKPPNTNQFKMKFETLIYRLILAQNLRTMFRVFFFNFIFFFNHFGKLKFTN